jgi:hypothetical protein
MQIIENWSEFIFKFSVGAVGGLVAQLYGGVVKFIKGSVDFCSD